MTNETAQPTNVGSNDGLGVTDELRPVAGQHYGTQYSCGICDSVGGGIYRVREEPTHWWLGLESNGQAHYLCDDCKGALWNVHPVLM